MTRQPAARAADIREAAAGTCPTAPVSASSPRKAAPSGGATPVAADAMRRGHGQVAPRLVHPPPPDAAPNRSALPRPRPAVRSRTAADQLEPPGVEPRGLAATATVGRADERLDLHGVTPPTPPQQRDRGAREPLAAAQRGRGVDRTQAPVPISYQAVSPSGPNQSCRGEDAEPRTRVSVEGQDDVDGVLQGAGPGEIDLLGDVAREHHRAPRVLREADTGRRWRPEPGRPRPGRVRCQGRGSSVRSPPRAPRGGRPRRRPGRARARAPARTAPGRCRCPRRRARAATCPRDSSPEASSDATPAAESAPRSCRRRVDLPIPGSPASRTTEPGTKPPPRTRSRSASPVSIRRTPSSWGWERALVGAACAATPGPAARSRTDPQARTSRSGRPLRAGGAAAGALKDGPRGRHPVTVRGWTDTPREGPLTSKGSRVWLERVADRPGRVRPGRAGDGSLPRRTSRARSAGLARSATCRYQPV